MESMNDRRTLPRIMVKGKEKPHAELVSKEFGSLVPVRNKMDPGNLEKLAVRQGEFSCIWS